MSVDEGSMGVPLKRTLLVVLKHLGFESADKGKTFNLKYYLRWDPKN